MSSITVDPVVEASVRCFLGRLFDDPEPEMRKFRVVLSSGLHFLAGDDIMRHYGATSRIFLYANTLLAQLADEWFKGRFRCGELLLEHSMDYLSLEALCEIAEGGKDVKSVEAHVLCALRHFERRGVEPKNLGDASSHLFDAVMKTSILSRDHDDELRFPSTNFPPYRESESKQTTFLRTLYAEWGPPRQGLPCDVDELNERALAQIKEEERSLPPGAYVIPNDPCPELDRLFAGMGDDL